MNILLIEDDKPTLKALKFALSQKGNKVFPAINEVNALNQLQKNNINCVISDVNLPGSRIDDLIKKIRNNFEGKIIPVILISSEINNALIDQTLIMGADAFLPKPINFQLLIEVLERLNPVAV